MTVSPNKDHAPKTMTRLRPEHRILLYQMNFPFGWFPISNQVKLRSKVSLYQYFIFRGKVCEWVCMYFLSGRENNATCSGWSGRQRHTSTDYQPRLFLQLLLVKVSHLNGSRGRGGDLGDSLRNYLSNCKKSFTSPMLCYHWLTYAIREREREGGPARPRTKAIRLNITTRCHDINCNGLSEDNQELGNSWGNKQSAANIVTSRKLEWWGELVCDIDGVMCSYEK